MGDGCGCSFLPPAAHPITACGPRCASSSDLPSTIWWSEDPPPYLQVMVHTAFTNTSAKKQEKHPKYHNGSAEALGIICSCCSEGLDARLDFGTVGYLCWQLSGPLLGSIGSQCQGIPANHQVQLISSLRNQGNSQTAVKVSRSDAVYLPGWV